MPLTGPPWLSEAQIATLQQWVMAGAPAGEPLRPRPPKSVVRAIR